MPERPIEPPFDSVTCRCGHLPADHHGGYGQCRCGTCTRWRPVEPPFDSARLTTREFIVSVSADRDADVMALADALLDFLTAGGDEPLSDIVFSIDGVEPKHG